MAQLKVKGEYVGPGEQKTAERLRDELPGDWVIFAGRKLPGATRDDVDLIVVGRSVVFVLEEKAWGPRVVVGDNNWYVGDDLRINPLNRVAQVARRIAGLFRDHVTGYRDVRGKRVVAGVIMSHDRLSLLGDQRHDRSENILALAQAPAELIAIDDSWADGLGAARHRVLAYLDDMPDRSVTKRIGSYEIKGQLEVPGAASAYEARSSDGQPVILKCYPFADLQAVGNPAEFLRREALAITKLADIGRTWRAFPPFQSDEHGVFVVPVVPPIHGRTLEGYARDPGPERPATGLSEQVARDVVVDAFTALSDVHEYGLLHRALHPRRIWLGRRMRVMFSDFHLARVEGEATIRLWAKDYDISEDFRAPECAADVGLATAKSDVYSLALCLSAWLLAADVTDMALEDIRASIADQHPWAKAMLDALSASPSDRPSAEELSVALDTQAPPPMPIDPGAFEAGAIIDGRYEIIRPLGRGGFATSWLVHDRQAEQTKVLKQFHVGVPDELRAEYRAADSLHHDRCGRVYDIQVDRPEPYLVSEYVDGESLAARGIDRSVDELRTVADGVLEALEYIHSRDLIHGDVTPANVIVGTDGTGYAKLIDFGLAVSRGSAPMGGSPKFAAPEVLHGSPATPASDIFGFAASMGFAMLGRPLTRSTDASFDIDAPTADETAVWGEAGERFLRVILSGLARDPRERPNATEFRSLIQSARPVEPVMVSNEPLEARINPNVTAIRRLYRGSAAGNAGNRGLDDEFAVETYVLTLLDTELLPKIVAGDFDLVLLSGNPGDGKTSVLVKLGEQLKELGAVEEDADEAGWRLRLDGRLFSAVYDASESHGDLTSDDLVRRALDPVVSGEKATALIAVNDGRLLQFFTDNEDDYEELWWDIRDQVAGGPVTDARAILVDLKRRSLAALHGADGLSSRALAVLTDDRYWAICGTCRSQEHCPILANRAVLAGDGREAVAELMLMSHLRRRRRATFRDARSAAAWLITGDRSCSDIHDLEEQGHNPQLVDNALVRDLAFSPASNDYLISEWSHLDPSTVAAPLVDSLRRGAPDLPASTPAASVARAIYFGEVDTDIERRDVRPYRYLDEFIAMLGGGDPQVTTRRLLLGISRLVGAFGYRSDGLAVSSGMPESTWAVLHTAPEGQFTTDVPPLNQPYIEAIPDQLTLVHRLGPKLTLTLDTAEIILRAADGEIVNDPASDAIRQEIDSFVSQLSRQPSKAARIVDTSGSVAVARVDGPTIVLETS